MRQHRLARRPDHAARRAFRPQDARGEVACQPRRGSKMRCGTGIEGVRGSRQAKVMA
jgi:hypothetical protein